MQNMAPAQSVLKESRPVKVSPCPELKIDQHSEYEDDYGKRCVFFFGHAIRKAVRRGNSEQAPGTKVNESRDRVNATLSGFVWRGRPRPAKLPTSPQT
jgi:hypothetical protein